ncbi:zinc finger protein 107-like [Leptopilina heterotoma]|uniref:zinc finger protein 107-like n=1 Tax=Leptopilina heterotoma TaxID=63436 RepID=UPI001CA8F1C7|nr:zinc finger protein 107-like [Leptopilina heterotoma]
MEDSEYFQSSSENNRIKQREKYFCSKCQKRYKSQLGFSSHLKFNCIKLEEEDDDEEEEEEEEEENVRFKHPSCIQLRKRESPKINIRPSKFLPKERPRGRRREIKSSFRKLTPNTCYSCGKQFNIEYGLARHISEGCLNSLYKCPYCNYQEDNQLLGFFHVIKKHPELKVYLINKFRGKEKTLSRKMETYLRSVPVFRRPSAQNHTDASKKPPNNCETTTDQQKNSPNISENEEQYSTDITCPKNCGKIFSKSDSIDHHLKRFCPEVNRYRCAYCSRKFASFKLTISHTEEEHSNEQVCAISLHTKQKIYKNSLSERKLEGSVMKQQRKRRRSSTSSENLSKRQKIEENPKEKENLERKPKEKENLERKPKEKENLERKPKEKENLEKKPKEKEMEIGSKTIPCSNGCDRFFTLPRYEKIHFKYCTLPKRYQCPYCPVIYKMNSDVTSHIARHHPGMEIYSIDTLGDDPNSNSTLSAIDGNRKTENEKQKEIPVERYEKRKLHLKCPKCDTIYEHPDDLWEHFQKCPKKQVQNQVIKSPQKPLNDIEFVNISEPEILSQTAEFVGESNDLSYLDILEGPEEMDETLIDIAKDSDSDEDSCPKELSEEALNEEVSKFVRMEAENQANQGEKTVNQFVCPNKCGCKFTKQTTLKIHLSLCCQKPIRFKCPYCEFFTHGESNGFCHVEKYHSSEEISLIDLITRREVYPGKKVITIDENDIECVDLSSEIDESEQTMETSEGNEMSEDNEINEINELNAMNESTTILFQCRYCSYSTKKPEEGYMHMKMRHVNESNALICAKPPIDDEIQIID